MKKPRVIIIVQARMGSSRLPGKVLKPAAGKPLLEHQLERLRRVSNADETVVATSRLPGDDVIAELCARAGVRCHRGDERDVLNRFHEAARAFAADVIVRSTADCPLIDPGLVEELIAAFLKSGADYGSNAAIDRTYPRGLDAEVCTFKALDEAERESTSDFEREHVLEFILGRPERYRFVSLKNDEDLGAMRWTVDTPEDYELVRRVFETLYPRDPAFGWRDVLALLREKPEWAALNAHVAQTPERPKP